MVRLLVNFCYPSQKLVEKTRQGARLRRKYDAAQTPYQRVLAAAEVPEAVKERLRRQFEELNPVALRLEAERLFERFRLSAPGGVHEGCRLMIAGEAAGRVVRRRAWCGRRNGVYSG